MKQYAFLAVCILAGIGLLFWMTFRPPAQQNPPLVVEAPVESPGPSDDAQAPQNRIVQGGVARKPTDVAHLQPGNNKGSSPDSSDDNQKTTAQNNDRPDGQPNQVRDQRQDPGTTPPVDLDANPQVAAVVKRIDNRKENLADYAAAVSTLAKVAPFDRDRFRQDPDYRKNYLANVTPGRVFQTAQPGEGVQPIRSLSPLRQTVQQQETALLKVVSASQSPVTLTSFDLGRFSNQLTSITLMTDEQGVATTRWTASPGTVEDVHILAAGPYTSGQVRFIVHVEQ